MSGTQLAISQSALAAFLLALARTAGFVLVTPPFNTRSVPIQARVGVAVALALPVVGGLQATAPALDSGLLVLQLILQIATGLALGFGVMAAVAAVQAAGDLIDTVGGFSVSMALDPLLMVQTSVMGRLHQITAVTLLFVTDGHLMIVHGLTRSVQLMPGVMTSWGEASRSAATAAGGVMLGALQIAAPLVAAMLVSDVALGLLTRAAPALNAFALSYPLKILLTLLLAGVVIARLPAAVDGLVRSEVLHLLRTVTPGPGAGPAPSVSPPVAPTPPATPATPVTPVTPSMVPSLPVGGG